MQKVEQVLSLLRKGKLNRASATDRLNTLWLDNVISNTQLDAALLRIDVILNMQDCQSVGVNYED